MEDQLNSYSFVQVLIGGLLIGACYYFFFYQKTNYVSQISSLRSQISEAEQEVATLDGKIRQMQDMQKEAEQIESSLQKAYKFIPKKNNLLSVSQEISNEARAAGLSISSLSVPESWKQASAVKYTGANITVKGTFPQIMIFLSELTRKNQVYALTQFELSAVASESNRDSQGHLNLSGTLSVYERIPMEEMVGSNNEDEYGEDY